MYVQKNGKRVEIYKREGLLDRKKRTAGNKKRGVKKREREITGKAAKVGVLNAKGNDARE